MKYTINTTSQSDETLNVNVTYTMNDGSELILDVPIFAPQNADDVTTGIENRALSEQAKIDRTKVVENIIDEIPVGEVITI